MPALTLRGPSVVPPKTTGPITILHAPTDPAKKGTRFVVDAVARLQRHHPIRFVQVSNLPHAEALKLYPQADLVIDQLLAGWYGGFAVELMAMGKPVACYIRDEDLQFVPPAMAEPVAAAPRPPRHARGRPAANDFPCAPDGRPGASSRGSSCSAGTIRGGSPRR